jgi:hypothetical protein
MRTASVIWNCLFSPPEHPLFLRVHQWQVGHGRLLECNRGRWVMAYYFQGLASWSWCFPYFCAPLPSDLVNLDVLYSQVSADCIYVYVYVFVSE